MPSLLEGPAQHSLLSRSTAEPEHVVSFSGGLGSWHAARLIGDLYGTGRLTLLHLDAGMEDEDTYRFLIEGAADAGGVPVADVSDLAERALALPPVEDEGRKPESLAKLAQLARDAHERLPHLVWISQGKDVWDVYEERKFLGNNRVDVCSIVLKREAADHWMRAHFFPEEVILYLGYNVGELPRHERAKARWIPYRLESPLVDHPPTGDPKEAAVALCHSSGIEIPRLYRLGFKHSNCSGFCCRAGKSHFAHLLATTPARYLYFEEREERLRGRIGDYTILRELRERIETEETASVAP